MPIDIDILDLRSSNTGASSIVSQILRIVCITKLGHSYGHTLSLETLLIELIDLVGSSKFVTCQIPLRSIAAAITS